MFTSEELEINVTRSVVKQRIGPCKTEASRKPVPLDANVPIPIGRSQVEVRPDGGKPGDVYDSRQHSDPEQRKHDRRDEPRPLLHRLCFGSGPERLRKSDRDNRVFARWLWLPGSDQRIERERTVTGL